jgi:hypothetical protein
MPKNALTKMVSQKVGRREIAPVFIGLAIENIPMWRASGVAAHKIVNAVTILLEI